MTKLKSGKHMATGYLLVRVCICEEYMRERLELHVPQLLRLVCQLWPAIRQRAAEGEPLSRPRFLSEGGKEVPP